MDYMPLLREAGVGVFAYLHDDPPFREIAVPLVAVDTHNISWENNTARSTGPFAWITFALPSEVQAARIRLSYTHSNAKNIQPYLGIYWKSSKEADFEDTCYTKYSPTGDRANWKQGSWSRLNNKNTILEVGVCHPVQIIRIKPAIERATLKIHELTVLVPANADALQ